MKSISLVCAAALAAALGGCVVTPVAVRPAYVAPAGVVYVAPTYASPGEGWVWAYHANYGWGYHHPQHGWHKGWR